MTANSFRLHPNVLFAAGVMPLAAVLTFLFLGDKSFWLDEAFSITIAKMEWSHFWDVLFQYEANQGLYYFLLHLWANIGQSEFAVRSLSVIFALCSVVMIYIFGTRLFGARVGIIAALLITVNAFFIAYAQEARGYILALLLSTLSSYFFVKSVEKPNWKWWGAYVLASVLGVYTHLYVILLPVAQFASLIFLPRRDIPWKGLLISAAAMVLLLAPMAFFILTRDIGQTGWVSRPQFLEMVWVFNQLTGRGGPILLLAYFIPSAIALFFTVRIYLQQKLSLQLWRHALLLSWLFLPIILSFLFSYIKPIFVPRYFIIFVPPLVFLVAIGLSHIRQRWVMVGVIGVLVLLSSFTLRDWYTSNPNEEYTQKENWREITSHIVSSEEPGDAIVFFHPVMRLPFDYYRNKLKAPDDIPAVVHYLPVTEKNLNLYYMPEGYSFGKVIPDPDRSILDRLSGHDRVWLVLGHTFDTLKKEQSEMIIGFLQEKYDIIEEKNYFIDIRVILFTSKESFTR
jgi:uncharacterized membrane protein